MELGDLERGIEFNQKGLEIAHVVGDPEITINAQLNLADAAFAIGERARATSDLEELYGALPEMHEWMKWRYAQHLMHSLGEAVLAAGDAKRALALADECLALAEPTDSKKNVVKGRRLRGQALMAQGKLEQAGEEIAAALELARDAGNPPQLWKSLAAAGDLSRGRGEEQEALASYLEAMSVVQTVAAGLSDRGLQAKFLSSQQVRIIREAAEGRPTAPAEAP
jgi:predicted Zn-dependent protease